MSVDTVARHLALAQEATQLFPGARVERTSDVVQITLGDDEEETVLLLFCPDALEIRFRAVDWPLAHSPVTVSELWKRRKYGRLDRTELLKLIQEAQEAWTHRLARCTHCGKSFPPDRTIASDERVVCHACAERHEGIVF